MTRIKKERDRQTEETRTRIKKEREREREIDRERESKFEKDLEGKGFCIPLVFYFTVQEDMNWFKEVSRIQSRFSILEYLPK